MDKYLVVARKKIATLIRADDFKAITSISDSFVFIEFENKSCRVDNFGKVEWI